MVVDPSGEQLTMWSATQIPHILKTLAAATTGMPEHKLRVIAPDVGGGFGGKLQVTPEEILVLAASVKLGKPVKWTETRSESLLSAHHGRDQIQDITIAAKRDGTVLALDVDLLADMGAYLRLVTSGIPILGAFMFNSIYKFPAYRFACTNVFTSKTPTDAYRGAGRPEATFAIERIMDELAAELGREPLELREQNWIKHEEFPFTTVCGLEYDSGNYEAATAKAKELFGYDALRREQQERRERGRPGPARHRHLDLHRDVRAGPVAACSGRWRTARAAGRPRRSGCCRSARSRSSPARPAHGQGHETAWSQIVADQLGVPFEDIEVLHGDTQISPQGHGHLRLAVAGRRRDRRGQGRGEGGRQGPHDRRAHARGVRGRPGVLRRPVRGQGHGQGRDDPGGRDGHLGGARPARRRRAVAGLRRHLRPGQLLLPARHAPRRDGGRHRDRAGDASARYVCVDDVGNALNPLIVEGQVHGGLAQGIAQALFEEANYDEQGTLVNGTFVDYTLPSAADLPSFTTDRTETPATGNPLGVKGVGEAGTIASTPAIVNGVLDAVRHLGVTDVEMPCTPQRVWRAIQAAQGRATQETPVDTHSPGAGLGSIDPNNPQEEEVQ